MGAAKSDRNSSEEHEIDSFYGYLAHVELKIYCIPIIVLDSNLCSVESMVNARVIIKVWCMSNMQSQH